MVRPFRKPPFSRVRRTTGAVICSSSLAIAFAFLAPPAAGQQPEPDHLGAELAGIVARNQAEVDKRTLDVGELQERVNRAMVDLRGAQWRADQAGHAAADAELRVQDSHSEVEAARAALGEITRAVYRGSAAGRILTTLGGESSLEDYLDRSVYVTKQREARLAALQNAEQARNEAAHEEAAARDAAALAAAERALATSAADETRRLVEAAAASLEQQTNELESARREVERSEASLQATRAAEGEPLESEHDAPAPPAEPEQSDTAESAGESTPIVGASKYSAEAIGRIQQRVAELVPDAPRIDAETAEQALIAARLVESADVPSMGQPDATGQDQQDQGAADPDAVLDRLVEKAARIAASSAMGNQPQAAHAAPAQPYQALSSATTETIVMGSSTGSSVAATAGEAISALAGRVRDAVTEAATDAQLLAGAPEPDFLASSSAAADPGAVETVLARAQSMIGAPYVWGGGDASGPTTGINGGTVEGFDCSGLVLYAFAGAGLSLPHYTGYQYQRGTAIDPTEAQRGDLLFWGPSGDQHVAIYLGDGMMIEAPSSGQDVAVNPVRWEGMSPHAVRLL